MIPSIVPAAVLSVLTGLCVWAFQDARHEAELSDMRLHAAEEKGASLIKIRQIEGELNEKYTQALNSARDRERSLRADVAALRDAAQGLRAQHTEAMRRIAQAPAEAVREYAETVSDVFGECQARYAEVAEAADRHSDDVRTLIEAWPVIDGSTPD